MSFHSHVESLRAHDIAALAMITVEEETDLFSTSTADDSVLAAPLKSQTWDSLRSNPYYDLLQEFEDVFPDEVPCRLPVDKGVQHEIDLVPGAKYFDAIDAFFAARKAAGHVRESISPHNSPTFCVKKPGGKWHIVHAFNKLNAATIPAQTPIPRKDVIIDGMGRSTIFSTIDLRDGFYQILMRLCDVPKTAVSTPSGMLWEWLVMPQGLSNAPVTFNRMVTAKFRAFRDFAPSYFDDIYVHSCASSAQSGLDVHRGHLRKVLEVLRANNGLYANLAKYMFCVDEIPVLGDLVGVNGCRADPGKIKAISEWPIPSSVKDLRRWLGLATYLHKYSQDFADIAQPLFRLLLKDAPWVWDSACQEAFDGLKSNLQRAPILTLPDFDKPFSVVCDASQFAIGCCLMQLDASGRPRPVSYQSCQFHAAEQAYPVHDLELLSMKYTLTKFRIYLLGGKPFVVYTDHASLRTATNTPHLSQRMARWISFFSEFTFSVQYKPGKDNILADAVSRRPDLELTTIGLLTSGLHDRIRAAYPFDADCSSCLAALTDPVSPKPRRASSALHRFALADGF
ncbi:hypothetical protein AaE_003599 [Aphanomyces astaci]|uniref:Reverse transcriptase domain-containing protein n=1 Tax=Aphanomyces astaci TaxID=112090 RepID=A0A6A5ARU8_APHAT|nr:hypothetical protein AaE_003599 [Aphanomyces astaci]